MFMYALYMVNTYRMIKRRRYSFRYIGPRDSSTLFGHLAKKKCYFISDNWPLALSANIPSVGGDRHSYNHLFKKEKTRKTMKKEETQAFPCLNIREWKSTKTNK